MYVNTYIIAVPEDRKDDFVRIARGFAVIARDFGALEIFENWELEVPDGIHTDYRKAVRAEPGEKIVISWVVWPDRETGARAHKEMFADPRMEALGEMPFDGKRMILGGFEPVVAVRPDEPARDFEAAAQCASVTGGTQDSACDVTLRPYAEGDIDDIYAAATESYAEIGKWMPWCHAEYARADAEAWIHATAAGRDLGTMYDFAVIADGEYAGGCGINHINWMDGVANLGYWVRTPVTCRGVATRAARELIAWTFANTKLNRIEIVAACENIASRRVAEKLGATRDGILRKRTIVEGKPVDAILYSVVRPD